MELAKGVFEHSKHFSFVNGEQIQFVTLACHRTSATAPKFISVPTGDDGAIEAASRALLAYVQGGCEPGKHEFAPLPTVDGAHACTHCRVEVASKHLKRLESDHVHARNSWVP